MRLFLATWIPEELAQELELLSFDVPGSRPIPASRFHITIRFLGDCSPLLKDEIETAMTQIVFTPFTIHIQGIGQFAAGIRVVWARVESMDLLHLERKIRRQLEEAGIRTERRRFRPHITLGRVPQPDEVRLKEYFTEHYNFNANFECKNFGLYSSRLNRDGPEYTEEALFPR